MNWRLMTAGAAALCAGAVVMGTQVGGAFAGLIGTSQVALWQELDLEGTPEVVQAMDSCLQDYADWQAAANAGSTGEGFACRVISTGFEPEVVASVETWMQQQFMTEGWTMQEQAELTLMYDPIGERTTGAGFILTPASAAADTSAYSMVNIGLMTGRVSGCDQGIAFIIMVDTPQLGVPRDFCYEA